MFQTKFVEKLETQIL